MGVPKFYRWVSERYPLINIPLSGTCRAPAIDNLYLDMNGVVHNCARAAGFDDGDGRYVMSASAAAPTQDEMLLAIFKYIDMLVTLVRPRALLYMAIDGVAPRAKMNQQRSRRFRSAQERAEEHAAAAEADPYAAADAPPPFDSNCITPGTVFMARLTQVLQYFAQKKLAEDASWAGLSVVLSGAEVPGEGEHKIMEYIRQQKLSGALGSHTRHCLYGLDADLIMLGLVTHERHFALLREKVDYTSFARKRSKPRSVAKLDTVTFGEFELLSVGVLREYIDLEFRQALASLPDYNLERVVDDFVFMMFLVGNDFLPNLPTMDIKEGALNVMIQLYKGLIPRLGGYLSDAGTIHPSHFEVFISKLGQLEAVVLKRRSDANKRSHGGGRGGGGSKSTIAGMASEFDALWGFTPHHLGSDMDSFEEEEEVTEVASTAADTGPAAVPGTGAAPRRRRKAKSTLAWDAMELTSVLESGVARSDATALAPVKENYYREKMNLLKDDVAGHHALCKAYIEGLVWTLRYYYHGCASWRWFYPFHYAPMASDLVNLTDLLTGVTFERGVPFLPQEQLLSVLPASSSWCLPKPYAALMTDPRSPIAHFYPLTFDTDMNSKKNPWEAVVLLPFVDEQALLKAMASVPLEQLTSDERRRNTFGTAILYTAPLPGTPERLVPSPFPDLLPPLHTGGGVAPHVLPPVPPGVGFVAELPRDDGPEACVAGASWPAIRPVPVTSRTDTVNVNVFGMPSRGESLVVVLGSKARPRNDFIFFDTGSGSDDDAGGKAAANGTGGHAAKKGSNGHAKLPALVNCKSVGDVVAAGIGVGSYVLVDFPWRCPALVEVVMDATTTVQMSPAERAVFDASGGVAPAPRQAATVESKTDKSKFSRIAATVAAEAMERRALDLGNVRVVIQARPAVGRDPLTDVVTLLAPAVGCFSAATTLPCPPSLAPRADGGCSAPPLRVGSRVLYIGEGPFFGTAATVMKILGVNDLELRFPFPTAAAREPAFGSRVVAMERQSYWLPLAKLAAKAGVHPALASRVVGSLRFSVPGGRGREEVDLGLGVKYTGRGLVMPGYARQEGGSTGPFTYSPRCAEVLGAFRAAFPALFVALTKASLESRDAGGGEPIFDAAALLKCPASQAAIVVADAVAWLGASELPKLPLVSVSADVVSPSTVLSLEREAKVALRVQAARAAMAGAGSCSLVVPRSAVLLGTEARNVCGAAAPGGSVGRVPHLGLDGSDVRTGDRVVNRSITGPVPLGLRGTVVGVVPPGSVASAAPAPLPLLGGGPAGRGRSGSYGGGGGGGGGGRSGGGSGGGGGGGAPSTEAMVEVVFDAGFVSGGSLHGRCSSQRGKAVAASQLVMLRPDSKDAVYRRLWHSENAKLPAVKQSSPLPPPQSQRAAAGMKAGATSYAGATSASLGSVVSASGAASVAARTRAAAPRGGGGGGGTDGAGSRGGGGGGSGGAAKTGAPPMAASGMASVRPPLPAGAMGVWKPLSWGELSRRDDGAGGAAPRAAPKAAAPAASPASAAQASATSFQSRGRGGGATGGGNGAFSAGSAGGRGAAPPSRPTAPAVVMPDPSQLPLPSFASGRGAPPTVRVLGSRPAATPAAVPAAPNAAAVAGTAGPAGAPSGRRGGRPPRKSGAAARGGAAAAGAPVGAPASATAAPAPAAGVDVSAALQSLRLHSGAAPSKSGRQKSVLLMGVSGARHSSGSRGAAAAARAPPPPTAGATGAVGGVAVAATMDLKNMLGLGGPAVALATPMPLLPAPSTTLPAGGLPAPGVVPAVSVPGLAGVPVAEARSPGAAAVLDESAYWAALQQEHTTTAVQGGGGGGGGGGSRGGRPGRRGGGSGGVPLGGGAVVAAVAGVTAAAGPAAAAAGTASTAPSGNGEAVATAGLSGRGRRRNRRGGGARRGGGGEGSAAATESGRGGVDAPAAAASATLAAAPPPAANGAVAEVAGGAVSGG